MNRTMLAAAATLTMLAWPQTPTRAEPVEAATFMPPAGPLIVTRTVVRKLADGNEIVARRSYLVTFQPDGDAFAVSGTLVASEIAAPPALRALAELERQRTEPASFPIRLDRHGKVLGQAAAPGQDPAHSGAAAARQLVATADVDAADKRYADNFIAETAARGAAIPWPGDLFSPTAADSSETRAIVLADGSQGTVSVAHRITARLASGAPASFVREVVTEIAENRRTSREEWTIGARVGP